MRSQARSARRARPPGPRFRASSIPGPASKARGARLARTAPPRPQGTRRGPTPSGPPSRRITAPQASPVHRAPRLPPTTIPLPPHSPRAPPGRARGPRPAAASRPAPPARTAASPRAGRRVLAELHPSQNSSGGLGLNVRSLTVSALAHIVPGPLGLHKFEEIRVITSRRELQVELSDLPVNDPPPDSGRVPVADSPADSDPRTDPPWMVRSESEPCRRGTWSRPFHAAAGPE